MKSVGAMAAVTCIHVECDGLILFEWRLQGYDHTCSCVLVLLQLMEWFTFEVLLWRFLCDLTAMVSSVHSVNDSNEAWFGFVHLEASIWICPLFSNLDEVSSKSRTRYVHITIPWVFGMLIKQGCFVFVCLVWLLFYPHTCLIGY